ncbi:MAG: 2-polyprenyl-3-methyl-6-methoxy-1,4-benzoquinone monooxygenase [Methylotenera sp.]|nr:2-polyprenyl-3-methyl-6-methoxy-1,4-benzoquinone monooxygenase [Methylotenera sp.]
MSIDKLITTFDTGLRTVFAQANASRQRPDAQIEESTLTETEKNQAAALMRINHVGEVCAQALYSGQALSSRNPQIVQSLQKAANEETDHLAWCEARINELGGRKSWLNPVWYAGSFALGAAAGALDDKWNLGFLAETEHQVSNHLQSHLTKLSDSDTKTRAIIGQMQQDEAEHALEAKELGASDLPQLVKAGMKLASKIMTSTAYYV